MIAPGILIPIPLLGLVDTGAPYTMVPEDLARALGVRARGAPRVGVVVAGWRGRAPLVSGLSFRIRGQDLDAAGREVVVEAETSALLVPGQLLLDFALLGQTGFLDRIDEFCVREKEAVLEVQWEGRKPAGEVREGMPRYPSRRGRIREWGPRKRRRSRP
ncbi:MAG TPA: aspartyl protease family protein [Planctomycetota bacterium]|nr:aspartyl protease family protein [Planctomycetota bacterium]